MSNAVTWASDLAVLPAAERDLSVRRATIFSVLIAVVTIGLGACLYFGEKRELAQRASAIETRGGLGASELNFELLRRIDRLALSLGGMALVGGAGAVLALLAAGSNWHRRLLEQAQDRESERQREAAVTQAQISEFRRAKDNITASLVDCEAQLRELRAEKTRLQEELDRRNRAERALAQKRQELESSKSVLQLHVQARTEELEQLQRRYELILNSAGEGICGLDLEGKTTFVNPTVARLTGWAVDELVGKHEHEIFFANGEGSQDLVASQSPQEHVFCRKDGTRFPVELVKSPIEENGRPVGAVLMFKDITERKRVEETLAQRAAELARSNSELEQFAFVASHDLQEPLRKIQAFGDRLKTKCSEIQSPEVQDYLGRMQNAAARMRTLINDLLAFSRVIRSSEPFAAVNLGEITREVLGDLEVRIEKTGAKVQVDPLPTIDADPMQVRQLMLNLLSNGLKFQPKGNTPVIKISCRTFTVLSGEEMCELSVQDNGIGFDEKYLDRMFAVFQRLHGRNEYEGTGVGLAVCRRIVDRHHGRIIAHSQPGQGATFVITLPVHQAKPQPSK